MSPLTPWALVPVLAADVLETVLNVADVGTTIALLGFFLKQWMSGQIRRKDEVDAALGLVKEADARTALAVERAERAEQAKERIQEAVLKEQGLASLELSMQGKELVRSATRIQERMEKLVDTFLELLHKVIER